MSPVIHKWQAQTCDKPRHPLLASLRLQIKLRPSTATGSSQTDAAATEPSNIQSDTVLSSVVVEAVPCRCTDIPNDSMEAINGLLAGHPKTSERLTAMPLDRLRPSPFYNMLADGEPADKALTLLLFTQLCNGKHLSRRFRIVSGRVQDATVSEDASNQYATVSFCTIQRSLDFTSAKDSVFIAVISKVVPPSKPEQHVADIHIENLCPRLTSTPLWR